MGLGPRLSSCGLLPTAAPSYPYETTPKQTKLPKLPNPDPNNFKILYWYQGRNAIAAIVEYPDCSNYEGLKILVFDNCNSTLLEKQTKLDPHFCDDNHLSPFARFEPTRRGLEAAYLLVRTLNEGKIKSGSDGVLPIKIREDRKQSKSA